MAFKLGGLVEQTASTATAGGTTTLLNSSKQIQVFTGTAVQTVVLPDATTMFVGQKFEIYNTSSNVITVNTNGGANLTTISAGKSYIAKLIANGAAAGTWANINNNSVANQDKNYLTQYTASTASGVPNAGNGNFEFGSTAGWSLGTVGTLTNGIPTGSPTFGSGASGNLSITTVSSGQLAGSYSLSYVSSAATTQGNMLASNAFFIDSEDQAKVLTWKFYYTAQTGTTTANWSGTSSNSFGVAVYDVTNSSWLLTTANFGMTQSSGVGYATGTTQTNTTTTQLRFVIYNVNATTGAITLYFDDCFVGPQTAPSGPAMTDWISYTPTGSWSTNTTYTGKWRRVGDSLEYQIKVALTGAPTGNLSTINFLPSGFTVDTNKILGTATLDIPGGIAGISNIKAGGAVFAGYSFYSSTTAIAPTCGTASGTFSTNGSTITTTAPGTFANGDFVEVAGIVPIAGWSSNAQMSNDTDTRVVAASYAANGNQTAGNAVQINFPTQLIDTHAAVTTGAGAWKFTAPVSGYYQVDAQVQIGAATSCSLFLYKNGSQYTFLNASAASGFYQSGTVIVQLNAGDFIDLRNNASVQVNGNGASAPYSSLVSINRLSGPSVIAATESVNMSYGDTSGAAIGTGIAVYKYATKIRDTHNAYSTSTGLYTVPVSGMYRVSGSLSSAAVTLSTTQSFNIYIYYNGNPIAISFNAGNGASHSFNAVISASYPCNAGDTLAIEAQSNVATTGNTGAGFNNISIERIGN